MVFAGVSGNGGGGRGPAAEALGFGVQVVRGRWFMVYACLLIMSAAGGTYIFGSYSKDLKSTLGYNQQTLNTLSFFKDLGANVGIISGLINEISPPWVVLSIGAAMNLFGYLMIYLAITERIARPAVWQMCIYICAKLLSLTAMDELMGKTAEQVAFEGVASAIIRGRNIEGSSFSAARSVTTAKMMAKAMVDGRKEETSTGIWNEKGVSVTNDEILAFSMQKMAEMAVEGLKIQAETAEEEAAKAISGSVRTEVTNQLLDSAISLEEWAKNCEGNGTIKILLTIQPRDPNQRFEPVGGIQIAVLQAVRIDSIDDEENKFKVMGIHLGGLKLRSDEGQRQRETSLQWLMSIGKANAGWKRRAMEAKIRKDIAWSLSSGMEEDTWFKPRRNPNVKFSYGSS